MNCLPISKDIDQLCADTRCSLEDLPGMIDDWDGWQERELRKSVLSGQLDDDDEDNDER